MPNLNIGQIGGLLRNLGGQAVKLYEKDLYGAAKRSGIPLRRAVEGNFRTRELAKTFANMRSTQAAGGFAGLAGLSSFTGDIENSLNRVGPAIDRFVSNVVPDNIENWAGRTAREMEKGGLINAAGGLMVAPFVAAQTYGQPGGYNTVQRPLGTKSRLGGNEVSWKGPDLGWQRTYSEGIQNQSLQRPISSISAFGGNEVSRQGDNLGGQRTYAGGASPPSAPAPGSPQNLFSGRQAGQVRSNRIPNVTPNVISNGAGVPARKPDVINRALSQEVLNAAQQFNAPTNVPLPSFYEGQQQLGRSMMQKGTLVSQLQGLGGAPGMTPENLKIWAEKNPALAYRELLKLRERQ
jgi:hypothetical protein